MKINVHSMIDVITNSSTEIFISNIKQEEEQIKEIVDSILAEVDCSCVMYKIEYSINDSTGEIIPHEFDLGFETGTGACGFLKNRLLKVFGRE